MTRKLTPFVAALAMLVTVLGTGALAAPDQSDRTRAELVDFWTVKRLS